MLQSLHENSERAHVFILCMDIETSLILKKLQLPGTEIIEIDALEDEELRSVKRARSTAEYCWTLSPCLPSYIFTKYNEVNEITYLDADLYFYSSIQPLLDEMHSASISIIEHRFTPKLKHLEIYGRFCVEWVSFKRDAQGLACLSRWREQCLEWCYSKLEDDRMGDQKYLDEWPHTYSNVCILEHLGAGVAPWNFSNYQYDFDSNGGINVNGFPLIFYHFHQLQQLSNGEFDRLGKNYLLDGPEPDAIYQIYETKLKSILLQIRQIDPTFKAGLQSVIKIKARRVLQYFAPEIFKDFLKAIMRLFKI